MRGESCLSTAVCIKRKEQYQRGSGKLKSGRHDFETIVVTSACSYVSNDDVAEFLKDKEGARRVTK